MAGSRFVDVQGPVGAGNQPLCYDFLCFTLLFRVGTLQFLFPKNLRATSLMEISKGLQTIAV
eukprot:1763473-Karenia_brevis.AAC.1